MITPHLRTLGALHRLGLSMLLLVLLGGLVAGAAHLVLHHQNRDDLPGLSMDDVEGVYHGVQATAPLLTALDRGHPQDLSDGVRDALRAWLLGDKVSENYDNLDLGMNAPAELLDQHCLQCHARQAETGDIGKTLPLDYWDDVKKVAFSRDVSPVDTEILVASAHTHALAMGTLSLLLAMLLAMTRFHGKLGGLLVAVAGLGLLLDLGSWFLARDSVALIPVIVAGGTAWMVATALSCLAVLLDLWLPRRAA